MFKVTFEHEGLLAVAEVPHLEPFARAIASGRDASVRLPDGRKIRPSQLRAVTRTGQAWAVWRVRECGLDGVHDWLKEWREVAAATAGLTPADHRWQTVLEILDLLDQATADRDAIAWAIARAKLRKILELI